MSSQDLTLPEASIADSPVNTTDTTKLFTPNMILVSTLLGGALAGFCLILYNYNAIGETPKAKMGILFGFLVLIAVFIMWLFLPASISIDIEIKTALSVGSAIVLKYISKMAFGTSKLKAAWWISIVTGISVLVPSLILIFIMTFLGAP